MEALIISSPLRLLQVHATAVNVSGPYFSKVFFYKESLGKETWQTYAYKIFGVTSVTLQIQGVAASSDSNIACWPIIDDLLLTGVDSANTYKNDVVSHFSNRGFEVGPGFLETSSHGILLEDESKYITTSRSIQSALYPWIVLGTVKYIDSKHYAVPQGLRAVELVSASGNPSGILYHVNMYQELQVILEFIMGDAGDSCVGDFTVVAQVGPLKWNFMMRSNGVGSRKKYLVNFQFNKTYITTMWFLLVLLAIKKLEPVTTRSYVDL